MIDGDIDGAAKIFEKILAIDKTIATTVIVYSDFLIKRKQDIDKGIEVIERVIDSSMIERVTGNSVIERVVDNSMIERVHIDILCKYGSLLMEYRNDLDGAADVFKTVLTIDPNHGGALYLYGILLLRYDDDDDDDGTDNDEKALELLKKALQVINNDEDSFGIPLTSPPNVDGLI